MAETFAVIVSLLWSTFWIAFGLSFLGYYNKYKTFTYNLQQHFLYSIIDAWRFTFKLICIFALLCLIAIPTYFMFGA